MAILIQISIECVLYINKVNNKENDKVIVFKYCILDVVCLMFIRLKCF